MLQVKETAIAPPGIAATMGLPAEETGLIFALRGEERVTLAGDVEYTRFLREVADSEPDALKDLVIPAEIFPLARPGWPDD